MTVNKVKYKISGWSITNIMQDTPAMITRLQMIVASISATVAGSTWYASDAKHAIWVGIASIIVDKIILGGLSIEEVTNEVA
jgi:hypothetical protein